MLMEHGTGVTDIPEGEFSFFMKPGFLRKFDLFCFFLGKKYCCIYMYSRDGFTELFLKELKDGQMHIYG
jgi:hypothetical protein